MDESGSDYGSFNSMLSEEEGDKGDKYEREENVWKTEITREIL